MDNPTNQNSSGGNRGRGADMAVAPNKLPTPPVELPPVKIGIELPPDNIFKFRQRRQNAAQGVLEGNVSYVPERAEYVEGQGNFVHYYGAFHKDGVTALVSKDWQGDREAFRKEGWVEQQAPKYPSRCVAPADAIYAVNPIKSDLMTYIHIGSFRESRWLLIGFLFMGRRNRIKWLTQFLEKFRLKADKTMNAFWMGDDYYCPFAKEVRKFARILLTSMGVNNLTADRFGEALGAMYEYDNAHRYRPQDLAGETTKEALISDLPRELERLLSILASRENIPGGGQEVVERFRSGVKLLKYAWMVPSIRRALRNAINAIDLEKCKMDESDIYHTLLFADYNAKGKTQEERFEVYRAIHGSDPATWPPRIMIRTM